MSTLSEIESRIESKLDTPEDQLTEEEKLELERDLIELAGQEEDKVDASGYRLSEWAARAEFYKEQSAMFAAKQKACLNKISRLKEQYAFIMQANGLKKISGKKYSISLQNSAPSLHIDNPSQIPTEYWIPQEPVLSKSMALNHLKAGVVVPGCSMEQKLHIRIR